MCGIAGFYNFRDDGLIKNFSKELAHRGPDGEGLYMKDQVTLLNRRLAIIDVKGGDQPIFNEDGSVVVVYNGEIYNYRDLKDELENKGHIFKTKSDTEVIIHGYEEFGVSFFDRLNGMFAIALWDEKMKQLLLIRDHFGIKPLYYAIVGNKLIFSSEIKPIFRSGFVKKKPNDRTIYRYLKFRIHEDQKDTFFEGINKLLPGEMLSAKDSIFKINKFTRLEDDLLGTKVKKDLDNDSIKVFQEKLDEAIKLRLISEVPVGSCLSGGLDSSTVVMIVNRLLKQKVSEAKSVGKKQKVFSAIFPDGSNNEEKYINDVLKSIKLESHKVTPKPEEFFKEIEDFVRTQEEPTISTGPYAQYKVMEEVTKNVTVLLDGQGADEMMAGYLPYYFVYYRQLLKEKKFLKIFTELFTSSDVFLKYLTTFFSQKIPTLSLLDQEFAQKYEDEKFSVVGDNLKKRLVEDIFRNSLPSLLRYEDRNSMAFSVEGRVPFLDFNLLRYLFALSDEAIIKRGWNKNILRQATGRLLPKSILWRRNKIGFTTPEYQWFLRMKNKIYQFFLSETFAKRKYFNQTAVLRAFELFIEGKVTDTMIFWRILNIELWLRIFFDQKPDVKKTMTAFGFPNSGKKIEIEAGGKKYSRFPIKTGLFARGDDFAEKIVDQIPAEIKAKGKWFLVVSEKIVAISQGRSYFLWEIKPGFWAKTLSNFVTKTPYGIGLGSPWTMQLAISEVGIGRILFATVASFLTKLIGIKGIFYRLVGPTVAAIDGPTEYSLYPSNVSAKLGPKNPQEAAKKIHSSIAEKIKSGKISPLIGKKFLGVCIIDANDLGRNILGNSTNVDNALIEEIFADNPMGQADEQTPLVLVTINENSK